MARLPLPGLQLAHLRSEWVGLGRPLNHSGSSVSSSAHCPREEFEPWPHTQGLRMFQNQRDPGVAMTCVLGVGRCSATAGRRTLPRGGHQVAPLSKALCFPVRRSLECPWSRMRHTHTQKIAWADVCKYVSVLALAPRG